MIHIPLKLVMVVILSLCHKYSTLIYKITLSPEKLEAVWKGTSTSLLDGFKTCLYMFQAVIKAKVRHSQSVSKTPLCPWIAARARASYVHTVHAWQV